MTPIAQPFRVEIGHPKIHQAGFGGHLAIAITQTLAVRTIDQVSAQIETTDGPEIKTIDTIEQLVGARERTDRFQIAFDEQGFEIGRRWCLRQPLNNGIAKAMVVELRAKLLVGPAGGDEFIGLMKRLIADFPIGGFEGFVAWAPTHARWQAFRNEGRVASVGVMDYYPLPDRQRWQPRSQPTGKVRAKIHLETTPFEPRTCHRGNSHPNAVRRTRLRLRPGAGRREHLDAGPVPIVVIRGTPGRVVEACVVTFAAVLIPNPGPQRDVGTGRPSPGFVAGDFDFLSAGDHFSLEPKHRPADRHAQPSGDVPTSTEPEPHAIAALA